MLVRALLFQVEARRRRDVHLGRLSRCPLEEGELLTPSIFAVIAGFFTGGSLAIRGGFKAARNSAIMCGIFLAVIEGVGIGFQRMMADNTKLEV